MRRTDKKKSVVPGSVKLDKRGITVAEGLSIEDTYRAILWNLVIHIDNPEALYYLMNAAITYHDRENKGIKEFDPLVLDCFGRNQEYDEALKRYRSSD